MKDEYSQYISNLEITDDLVEAVARTVRQGDLSWPFGVTKEFERAITEYLDVKFALAHCNGTSAMYSAMFAAGVDTTSEVICPTYTFWASISPAVNLGAKVVFCDINEDDLLINLGSLQGAITEKTKAIIVPHLWGRYADIEGIKKICEKHTQKIFIIEDASHCFGARSADKFLGTLGDIGIFSLQAGKCLVAGEGGLLVTNSFDLFDRSVYFGHYERIQYLEKSNFKDYTKTGGGYKFRIHPLGAAIALSNLKDIQTRLEQQNSLMDYFESKLNSVNGLRIATDSYNDFSYGGRFGLRAILNISENDKMNFIKECNDKKLHIENEYVPLLHLEKFFVENGAHNIGRNTFRNTEEMHKKLVSLPIFYRGNRSIIDAFVGHFNETLKKYI